MAAKEDGYIQLLRKVKATLTTGHGMSYNEFKALVGELGVKYPSGELFMKLFGGDSNRLAREYADIKHHMGLDAYMMLMEYEELKHSLEESKQARKEAKWAIWISIAAIVAQIIFR